MMRATYEQPAEPGHRWAPDAQITVPPDLPLVDESGERVGTVLSARPNATVTGLVMEVEIDDDSPSGRALAADPGWGLTIP